MQANSTIIPSVVRNFNSGKNSSFNSSLIDEPMINQKNLHQSRLSLERVFYFSLIVAFLLLIAAILICVSIRLGNENSSVDINDKDIQLSVSSAPKPVNTKATAATGDSPSHSDDGLVENYERCFDKTNHEDENAFTHLLSNANRYHFIDNRESS